MGAEIHGSARSGGACALLLVVFLVQAIWGVWGQDATIDERTYFGIGRELVSSFDWQKNVLVHPPLSFLVNSLPLMIFVPATPESGLFYCRLTSLVVFGVPLLLAVYFWARALYGELAGLMALTLAAFSPNLIAHAGLITADLPLTSTGFIALWLLWRTGERTTLRALAPWGVMLGLALATKSNAWILVGAAILLYSLTGPARLFAARARSLALGLALAWFVLGLTYGFRGLFAWRAKLALLQWLPEGGLTRTLGAVALPFFPEPYLATTFFQWSTAQAGWPTFLLGDYSQTGVWYYFVVAGTLKATLPLLILIVAALAMSPWVNAGAARESWLLVPPLAVLVFMSLAGSLQIGVRYLLPAAPFLFVFVSKVATRSPIRSRIWCVAAWGLVAWHALEGWSSAPQPLSYFNQIVGGRTRAYRYLADSNLDWGQNRTLAESYALAQRIPINPEPLPETGRIVVSVNALQGILVDRALYRTLRQRFEPVDHIGYNWLVFDLDRPLYPDEALVSVNSGAGWEVRSGDEPAAWSSAIPIEAIVAPFDPAIVYPGTSARVMRAPSASRVCTYRTTFALRQRAAVAILHLAAAGTVEVRLGGRPVFVRADCFSAIARDEQDLSSYLGAGEHEIEIRLDSCGQASLHDLFAELVVATSPPPSS